MRGAILIRPAATEIGVRRATPWLLGLLAILSLTGCPKRRGLEDGSGGTSSGGISGGTSSGGRIGNDGSTDASGVDGAAMSGSGGLPAGTGGNGGASSGSGGQVVASGGSDGGVIDGPRPAALSLTPASKDYDMVVTGGMVEAAFDVSNMGDSPSAVPMVAITGGADFTLANNGCTAGLVAGARCAVTVRFAPTTTGLKTAMLTAMATPGGSSAATLRGTGIAPGAITMTPPSGPFGSLALGSTSAPATFTVTNTGQSSTGALTAMIAAGAPDFALGNDMCSGKTLAPMATCTITVTFMTATAGPKSGTLRVSGQPGGTASSNLTGTGIKPAMLSSSVTGLNFSLVEIGTTTLPNAVPSVFTITNVGDTSTGALTLTNSNAPEFLVTNACPAMLAAGASCTITVSARPSGPGLRSGVLSLSGAPGGMLILTLNATGGYRVTVTKTGGGTVTSVPAGITCGTTCSGLFPAGSVALQARVTNGSGVRFAGWSGGTCSGLGQDCRVASASVTVTATFVIINANLAFATSMRYPTNLGSAAAYDTRCNVAATAVGINNAAGNSYVAMLSSSTSSAETRLTGARGWIRIDGRPFIDTVSAALTSAQVFNAVGFLDTGEELSRLSTAFVLTGIGQNGAFIPSFSCSDWTGVGEFQGGSAKQGAIGWVSNVSGSCQYDGQLLCMGKTSNTPVGPAVTSGRRIWITNSAHVIGSQTPNARCQSELPAGVTTAIAWVATTTRSAATLLVPTMNYVRVDGTLVGTGADLATATIASGVWQTASGAYLTRGEFTWTGSTSPSVVGDTASTCGNWTVATGAGAILGSALDASPDFWNWDALSLNCSYPARLYCVQTAP